MSWTELEDIVDKERGNEHARIRGSIHNSRASGKQTFLVLRDKGSTVQLFLAADSVKISKAMVKFCSSLPKETIVDVVGRVVPVQSAIQTCTLQNHEIHIDELWVVSMSSSARLPINLDDANRPECEHEPDESSSTFARVNLDTRLDHRVLDLRTLANDSIFKMSSEIEWLFDLYFRQHGFRKIHSPKMISAASEGGANVFKIRYFQGEAYLAQSPQLFKQMAICARFGRVCEIGPVFRAENSFTHRHLTEFTGIDLEMSFAKDYHEVVRLIANMFVYIFDALRRPEYVHDIETIRRQHPFEDLQYHRETLVLKYSDGVRMLAEAGISMKDDEDLR